MLNSVPGLMSYFLHSLGRWPLTRPICIPTTGLRIPNHAGSEWNEMRDTYLGMFSHISLSIECYFVLIRIFFTFDFIGLVSIDLKYSENDWLMICCHSFYRMWANKCVSRRMNYTTEHFFATATFKRHTTMRVLQRRYSSFCYLHQIININHPE